MISFKQYLSEARTAPLYHGTTVGATMSILRTGTIQAADPDELGSKFVSLTRSKKYAAQWLYEKDILHTNQVILELDQLALTHNYRIRPFNFFATQVPLKAATARYLGSDPVWGTNEYEERIYRDIRNIDRYLTAIHINDLAASKKFDHHHLVMYKGKYINQ